MAPWVAYHRDKLSQNGDPYGHQWMVCHDCQRWISKSARAQWRCGLMPSSDWTSETTPSPWVRYSDQEKPTICVGYSTSVPQVYEAIRARGWADRGLLQEFYDGAPLGAKVFDAIDLIDAEAKAVEAYVYRIQKDKQGK